MPFPILPSNGSGAYNLTKSLRFRSSASAYLNRTPASASNRTTWTWSAWIKRGSLGVDSTLFHAYDGSSSRRAQFYFDTNNNPINWIFSASGTCLSSTTFSDSVNIVGFQPFKTYTLQNRDVSDIVNVYDSNGNTYYIETALIWMLHDPATF